MIIIIQTNNLYLQNIPQERNRKKKGRNPSDTRSNNFKFVSDKKILSSMVLYGWLNNLETYRKRPRIRTITVEITQ